MFFSASACRRILSLLALASTAKRSEQLLCFFQSPVAFIPIDVLHESVDVHCGIGAEVHVIRVLEHVVHENGPAKCNIVGVVECNVVVKLAVAEIEVQNRPAAAAAKCCRSRSKALLPLIEAAEIG